MALTAADSLQSTVHMSKRAREPLPHGYAAVRLEGVGVTFEKKSKELVDGIARWYRAQLRQEEVPDKMMFDSLNGLEELWHPKKRRRRLSDEKAEHIVRSALSGNVNPQARPDKGLLKSGFGVMSHLRGTKIALEFSELARDVLQELTGRQVFFEGAQHLLLRPSDGKLGPHVDQMSILQIHTEIREMLSTTDDDANAAGRWLSKFGCQTLVHVLGAGPNDAGGHTMTLSNLTPPNYYLLLCMMLYANPVVPREKLPALDVAGGPVFFDFKCTHFLRELNRLLTCVTGGLQDEWLSTLSDDDRSVLTRCTPGNIGPVRICPDTEGPYLATWLVGWPHWVATGPPMRLTVNPRLGLVRTQAGQANVRRSFVRVWRLLQGGQSAEDVRRDKAPFEAGRVHKNPENEVSVAAVLLLPACSSGCRWTTLNSFASVTLHSRRSHSSSPSWTTRAELVQRRT